MAQRPWTSTRGTRSWPPVSSEPVAAVASWTDAVAEKVADGVHRLPLPLPDELAAVNVYALEQPDGLTLIDAGQAMRRCRSRLEELLAQLGAGLGDVRQFLVTHAHRDHYTLATQVRAEFGTSVGLGIKEAASLAAVSQPNWQAFRSQLEELRRAGAEELAARIEAEAAAQGLDHQVWSPPDRWLLDNEELGVGERSLRAIHTPGHTQGHMVFHDPSAELLFAGDHVLPHITPSIGLEPVPGRSPLADFLASLRRIRMLPDAMLLPAHGPAAQSVHGRVDELLEFHDSRLTAMVSAVDAGQETAHQVAHALTWTRRDVRLDALPDFHQMLAVVETAAHLLLLEEQGRLVGRSDSGLQKYSVASRE